MVKKTKRFLALALSACMVMGTVMTASAADGSTSVESPIYSMDVTNVVVPTELSLALNPEGLQVKVDGSTTSTDQVVSLNYGIVNKSSKDKTVKVDFAVTDLNAVEGVNKITFANAASEVASAEKDSYVVYFEVVPASAVSTSIDKDTDAATLADVDITEDASKAVAVPGSGSIGFNLEKATYALKSGESVGMGTTSTGTAPSNDVSSSYEVTALGTDGYTGFTFNGSLNTNTSWSKLNKGIKVDVTYSFLDSTSTDYGVVALDVAPAFSAGSAVGTITYTPGVGDSGLKSITSIKMTNNGKEYDGYNALGTTWAAATDASGTITFDSKFIAFYSANETTEATITYVNNADETKTATVTVKTADASGN